MAISAEEANLHSVSHYDAEIRKNNQQLDAIRTELDKGRKKLETLQKEEGNFLEQLEQMEKNINASQKLLATLTERIDTVEHIIKRLDDSLSIAENDLKNRQAFMRQRLRQAYMTGRPNMLLVLFSSKTPLDAVNKVKYLERIGRYDREMLQHINDAKTDITARKQVQSLELDHLAQLRESKASEKEMLVTEERQRKGMLADVRKEKSSFEAMVRELENSQKELVSMIKLLEKKRKKAKEKQSAESIASFEKRKGKLPWPVDGPVITRFGKVVHPEYQTVIMNNGIDIEAKKGDPVHCVASGIVIHTGWLRGLGKMVIIDHVGGYLSIYAHLESIDVVVDQKVTSESIVGKVGDTGSIGGTRMHFEIRKSSEALNPIDWLEKRS